MRSLGWRKTTALAVTGLALAAGGGAAVAASGDDRSSSFFDAVARHLGISTEQLADATRAAALEQVDAALEEGKITEEQAEKARERIESGGATHMLGPGFGGLEGPAGFHRGGPGFGGDLSATAAYLGLDTEELRERLRNGESLADVAEAEGKSVDGLEQTMLDATRQRLDEAVEAGRLTREQADAMLERIEERIAEIVAGDFPGPRWRGPHRGGPPPWAPGKPDRTDPDTSARTTSPEAGVL
jgi:hypothetical protein